MTLSVNARVGGVVAPPIAEVRAWAEAYRPVDGAPLLDVSQAVPSYPPPAEIVEHVRRVASEPAASVYTPIPGLPALREALAAHFGEAYAAPLDPSSVAVTAGCNQAFCAALTALAGPGDEVLLPLPYYFNHQMWLQMQGVTVRHVPFDEHEPVPDTARLDALASERTRALVVVTPSNPTGATATPEQIGRLFDWAADRGIALVLDETYKDFRDDPEPAHRLFDDARWQETLVHLYSFSKAYSLAAYRVGSVVCGDRLMEQVLKVLDCVAICAPRVGQEAALHGLAHCGAWRDARADEMRARAAALEDAMRSNAVGYRVVSLGAYFAYVRHPFPGQASRDVARWLAIEHGVLTVPGSAFGPGQEDYLRLAFANLDAGAFPELVSRLRASAG